MSSDRVILTDQSEREVVITPNECAAALEFWKYMNIPVPPSLTEAIDNFTKNPNIENQDLVKLEICKAIAESDHPVFKDPIFDEIVQECAEVSFEMQFNKDIEKVLSD